MSVPKNVLIIIKNILKKDYFGDRCKIKEGSVACSGQPVGGVKQIGFCREKDDVEKGACLYLDVIGDVLEETKPGKLYKFLIE